MFVCTVVLVVYLKILLNLNMNEITSKTHGFTPNAVTPLWLRPKNDKIFLLSLMMKSMRMHMKSDEKLHGFCK